MQKEKRMKEELKQEKSELRKREISSERENMEWNTYIGWKKRNLYRKEKKNT